MKLLGVTKYIKVSEETHQALTDLGSKGESYDVIIRRLIHTAEVLVIAQTEAPETASVIHELESRCR